LGLDLYLDVLLQAVIRLRYSGYLWAKFVHFIYRYSQWEYWLPYSLLQAILVCDMPIFLIGGIIQSNFVTLDEPLDSVLE